MFLVIYYPLTIIFVEEIAVPATTDGLSADVARDPLFMGLTGPTGSGLGGKVLRGVKGTVKYGLTSPTGLATSALFFPGPQIAKGLFGGDDPEIKKEEIAQFQVGQKGKDTKDPKVGFIVIKTFPYCGGDKSSPPKTFTESASGYIFETLAFD